MYLKSPATAITAVAGLEQKRFQKPSFFSLVLFPLFHEEVVAHVLFQARVINPLVMPGSPTFVLVHSQVSSEKDGLVVIFILLGHLL